MRRLLFLMPILLCAAVSAHAQSLDAFKQRLAEPTPGATLFNRAQVTVTEHDDAARAVEWLQTSRTMQGACVGDLPEGFSQAAEEGEIPDFQPFGPIKVRFRKIILFSLLFPGEYLTLRRYGTINN